MSSIYDVAVIGCGPGGQIAATRAAQLGLSVVCVDDWQNAAGDASLGGTCTNVGCIPAKALLRSSEHYEQAGHAFADHGIEIQGLSLNLRTMLARKDNVVQKNNAGIAYLLRKNKITSLLGVGSFVLRDHAGYHLQVRRDGIVSSTIVAKSVILATGSRPRALSGTPFDEKRVLSNTGALAIPDVPKTLCVIGAGAIGLELGSVWRRLGSEVTILEALPTLLPSADEQIAKEARRVFERQGLRIALGMHVNEVLVEGDSVSVLFTDGEGQAHRSTFDHLVVSIGRVPNTDGLNADAIGLQRDAQGFITVDENCQTNLEDVWAIGDVVRGPMLAHKAEEEGSAVAERIAGQKTRVDFNTIPWVIYTHPEIAWVGNSEQSLRAEGRDFAVGVFPFLANGRARANGDTTGMVKYIADTATDTLLGVHMIGPGVSELIAEAVVALEFRASSEDIGMICHPHPTLSEASKEAALAVRKRAFNI
jgi:dihydrolipoamide dehydrogenase